MNNDDLPDGIGAAGTSPQPEVLRALTVLASSSTEDDWRRFMEDLSVRAARLVKGHTWKGGFRPDSNGPNDPPGKQLNALAKRWNQLALDAYGKVVDGSWEWDPARGRSSYWASEYPTWPPEMISLFGFLWERLKRHVENLSKRDDYRHSVPASTAEEGDPFATEADKDTSPSWDKETRAMDYAAGELDNWFRLTPDEALALQENWDEVLARITRTNYEDKDLLRNIAEFCKTERMSGEDWEGRQKRKGHVQKKGARPRELVEDIFGRNFDELVPNDPLRTRINKAKGKLQEILVSVGVQRCIEAGRPEFAPILHHLQDEASDNVVLEDIITSLAGTMNNDAAAISLLLKEFAEHWIHWFERHRYLRDPGLPGPLGDPKR